MSDILLFPFLKGPMSKLTPAFATDLGAVYNTDDFARLVPVLLRHPDLWIVTDEIYEHVCYGGAKAVSLAAIDKRIAARTVTTNGFSKSYVMTGWRLGFAAGEAPVIRAMADLLGNIAGPPSSCVRPCPQPAKTCARRSTPPLPAIRSICGSCCGASRRASTRRRCRRRSVRRR